MPSEVEIVVERDEDEIEVTSESKNATEKETNVTQKVVPMPRPPPPFPQILVRKYEKENTPETLEQMLGYAKFMKDLVTKKRAVSFEDDARLQHCSAIAIRSLVQNKEDLGAFTISCTIRMLHFVKALCDLGVNINLMPLYINKKLGLGAPKLTAMRLLMVDRTVKKHIGVLQNVLVKVELFIFLANLVILYCEVDFEVYEVGKRSQVSISGESYCGVRF
ncbi:uncharacterized protein LOC125833103 [Solanum verrucosum]|uniref:uncharacterized protein LOC125833103 n=1 Tax=Solanum verrucosum TaxID=315347 RepID=UPI0020D063F0|nr:uncharacterized protein LOC125833103 [Solanum verrucosum]